MATAQTWELTQRACRLGLHVTIAAPWKIKAGHESDLGLGIAGKVVFWTVETVEVGAS